MTGLRLKLVVMSKSSDEGRTYEVRVRGRLGESWFEPPHRVTMAFEAQSNDVGVSVLIGTLDQAALRGLLTRIWDLNLLVLSVRSREPVAAGQ